MIILLVVSVDSLAQRKAVVYGNYLSLGRRLSDSRPQTFGHNGISDREVWTEDKQHQEQGGGSSAARLDIFTLVSILQFV